MPWSASRISIAATVVAAGALWARPAMASFQVNTPADTPDADPGDGLCADADGACSLRAAIQEANAGGGLSFIVLEEGETYTLTLAGAGEDAAATGDLDVTAAAIVQGDGATVGAAGLDRAFDVHEGAFLQVIDLTVTGGAVTEESGGGYRSSGELTLIGSTVTGCAAAGTGASGGAVFNEGGTLIVVGSAASGTRRPGR